VARRRRPTRRAGHMEMLGEWIERFFDKKKRVCIILQGCCLFLTKIVKRRHAGTAHLSFACQVSLAVQTFGFAWLTSWLMLLTAHQSACLEKLV
jgi:hypothetical protein